MTVEIRRVVTGHDASGRAIVLSDGRASRTINFREGCDTALIWTSDSFPVAMADDEDMALRDVPTALAEGTVFRVIDYAPGVAPRRHRTQSIDYAIVLSGEIVMELEEGEEVVLRGGDVLVQRGTIHNWYNRSDQVCRIAFVLIGAQPLESHNLSAVG